MTSDHVSMVSKRGCLIVFEGGDRSGKSTQVQRLVDSLSMCVMQRFPDRTTHTGQIINSYLQGDPMNDQAMHLLFSANRWESM